MKVKAEPINEATQVLGEASETEFSFLLIPANTYKLIADQARKEGCTAAQVFQKALLQYLRVAESPKADPVAQVRPRVEPAVVVKRRRP